MPVWTCGARFWSKSRDRIASASLPLLGVRAAVEQRAARQRGGRDGAAHGGWLARRPRRPSLCWRSVPFALLVCPAALAALGANPAETLIRRRRLDAAAA